MNEFVNRVGNHKQFYVFRNFQVSWSDKTSNLRVTNLRFFIDKVPFTLHILIWLMHYSTTEKGKEKRTQNSVKASFVTPGIEKNRKKGREFSVFANT